MYMHYNNLDPTFLVHVLYIKGYEYNTTSYSDESYQQVPYNKTGMTLAGFAGKLKMLVYLDYGCFSHAKKILASTSCSFKQVLKYAIF